MRWLAVVVLAACGRTSLGTHHDASASSMNDGGSSGTDADVVPDARVITGDAGIARTLTTLAAGQQEPYALAIDANNVYWTTGAGGTVMKHAKTGGSSTELAGSQAVPGGIAVDKSDVYWTTDDSARGVQKCVVGGCSGNPTTMRSDTVDFPVLVDAKSLYYVQNPGMQQLIVSCPLKDCSQGITPIAAAIYGIGDMALQAPDVYWTDKLGGTVSRTAADGSGKTIVLATKQFGLGIAVDSKNVYWTSPTLGTVSKCALSGCMGSPTILASGQNYPTSITTDGAFAYWTNQLGASVVKCSVDGCGGNPEVLVGGQAYPHPIAVDEMSVYWANINDGTIMKLTPK